ncbi:hypothetical protein [Rhodococcus sp. LB1]|jgi:hypothetical protein|uniref:hypothetical protein n=1 Tax=Rhodococcus sp. LB1 TaxID=1807499 RepID=UPI00077A751A|nr:hypothetical protein [Rhodococcus sp. LB1]KXX58006.1 hypothetical protein AZG88_47220 [Rhodococcus sp. LB1]
MDTDHQSETARRAGPQHTEHGYGTYEWEPQHGVIFRMDLDQFGTVAGVQISTKHPPRWLPQHHSGRMTL